MKDSAGWIAKQEAARKLKAAGKSRTPVHVMEKRYERDDLCASCRVPQHDTCSLSSETCPCCQNTRESGGGR